MSKIDLRNRAPTISVLPDMRLRVVRSYDVINYAVFTAAEFDASTRLPWGTPDEKYPETRLILQTVSGQHPAGQGQRGDPTVSPERHPCILTRTFETIDATAETPVGNADVSIGQDSLITVKQDWIQMSAGTALYSTVGVDVAPAPWTQCVLKEQVDTDDGTLRTIKRIYISKGEIAVDTQIKNEGALTIQTHTYVGMVPPTPSGYTVINQSVEYPNGNPVYRYTFAKGNGVIDVRERQQDGGLRLVTWVSLGPVYDAGYMLPPGVLMVKDVEALDGTNRYTLTCMQNAAGGNPDSGTALAYFSKHPFRYPGRAKAYLTTGTSIYTVTSGGGQTPYPFPAQLVDMFLSPPVDVELDSEITVSYQTSPVLTLGTSFWNPTDWATMEARFQQNNSIAAIHEIKSLSGFRAINAGTAINFFAASVSITVTGPATIWVTNYAYSCLGQSLYPMSSGFLNVYGGPPAPDNQNWVLSAKLEPAFVGLNGTQYFRKTQVAAYVPAQPALPV